MHYLFIYTTSYWLRLKQQKYKRKRKGRRHTVKYDLFKTYIIQVTAWQSFVVIYKILKKNHTSSPDYETKDTVQTPEIASQKIGLWSLLKKSAFTKKNIYFQNEFNSQVLWAWLDLYLASTPWKFNIHKPYRRKCPWISQELKVKSPGISLFIKNKVFLSLVNICKTPKISFVPEIMILWLFEVDNLTVASRVRVSLYCLCFAELENTCTQPRVKQSTFN